MSHIFSTLQRDSMRRLMSEVTFDMIVIGGGITGSGIALDAAARGLKTALIERKDFAFGTSSRSGKLIHGGLKYLKNYEFSIVREVGTERDIVYRNARHLVYPIQMLFPLIQGESFNPFTLKVGLTAYDRLAGVKKEERHQLHSKEQTFQREPLFNKNTVEGSGEYVEYRTDDSRLTMETAKTAAEMDAAVLNYAEVYDFTSDDNNQISGVAVKDELTGETFTVSGTMVVNAAGPWVDEVRKKDEPVSGKHMVHAKGIHLVFSYDTLPVKSSIYFQHNGRMIAVIPKGDTTYVGSTESLYYDDMDDIHVYQSECDYLIGCLHDMFPALTITKDDIISSWAGVRPLIGYDDSEPSELSRHDEIFESDSGLITIAGGKLTGYRKMAERVLNYAAKRHYLKLSPSRTSGIPLSGGHFASAEDITAYCSSLARTYDHLQLSMQEIEEFVFRYGSNAGALLQQMESVNHFYEDPVIRNTVAEAMYTVKQEMAASLEDFYDRRTSYLLFQPKKVTKTLEAVSSAMAKELGWKPVRLEREKERIRYLLQKSVTFLPYS
ncbi:glycerol-3-phosphate dehydrogenase/oxidase [Salibacterium halotolerans]|uniref:Glycerol-3-phosphate dehydrogenase n=1 Tax=Salibacterium halotolerans TaxID=1884432 RepID=A0A1I5TEQ8_9BACI|nr:glycerol-3-phosphate dehydrogenase/oxidase [Salibacterium halotolerans]SFP81167.1 glycerol-3-phosphate dehydrogenase [Salibacterium halotolerans]